MAELQTFNSIDSLIVAPVTLSDVHEGFEPRHEDAPQTHYWRHAFVKSQKFLVDYRLNPLEVLNFLRATPINQK